MMVPSLQSEAVGWMLLLLLLLLPAAAAAFGV
jgi:hypothetical protein